MKDEGATLPIEGSDWHVIKSISVENRGEEIVLPATGKMPDVIHGVREMVLTIVGDFETDKIDAVEVNGRRFKPDP